MRSLINDVLTLSRLDESAFGDDAVLIDLHAVAERVAGRLGSFAADQQVQVRVEGSAARIAGSETLAEEMLYNLIENGIRYNHEGGSVVMRVETEPAPSAGRHAAGRGRGGPGGRARERHGPRHSRGAARKVFERFFRVDKSRSKETGGTGLGLAIVKHAVLYHHGTIEVESAEGAGTTFVLRFPAA